MISQRQRNDYLTSVVGDRLLEETLAWIAYNIPPEGVYDKADLEQWARDNGFINGFVEEGE